MSHVRAMLSHILRFIIIHILAIFAHAVYSAPWMERAHVPKQETLYWGTVDMRFSSIGSALALFVAVAGASAVPATAQQAQPEENNWLKICNTDPQANKPVCLITQELRTDAGQFLTSIAIRETPGEARKTLISSVPVGMLIVPGVQMQIDGGAPAEAKYSICFPNACYAELPIDAGFISRLKAGGKLQITTINQQAKQVRFDMSLIGFTAAYDGEGIDPQALQQKQQDLQSELNKKAQEARDRLVAEQRRALDEASSN
ncbi:invasion associated locus B family protein [Acuticoccus sp. MNP-M23]|uniref:invasion associated locus B family protein n=1 Tax=Acuticoccus sp. MNP-M23 TaxID=3072793 RepID=UPI002815A53A|nr:invasion associated locus B family protein [Acuticoccus sp. MNP-M23]WMS42172.1 invasion associated locus B family protein [Acuticoccus sp. MNP-M23]